MEQRNVHASWSAFDFSLVYRNVYSREWVRRHRMSSMHEVPHDSVDMSDLNVSPSRDSDVCVYAILAKVTVCTLWLTSGFVCATMAARLLQLVDVWHIVEPWLGIAEKPAGDTIHEDSDDEWDRFAEWRENVKAIAYISRTSNHKWWSNKAEVKKEKRRIDQCWETCAGLRRYAEMCDEGYFSPD